MKSHKYLKQQIFKCKELNIYIYIYIYTQEISKITLSRNDDKRLQTFDRITSYL